MTLKLESNSWNSCKSFEHFNFGFRFGEFKVPKLYIGN
jgi:actin